MEQVSEILLEKEKEVKELLPEHSLRIFWISLESVVMHVFLLPVLLTWNSLSPPSHLSCLFLVSLA